MTNKQARRLCVNHWKRMLKLSIEDIKNGKEKPTAENCEFCKMYWFKNHNCKGCPVFEKTNKPLCDNTPYEKAQSLYDLINWGESKALKTFHKAVQKEIDFLESLEV